MADLYYISDDAYTRLCGIAIEQNFVRAGAIRKAGISRFLCRVSWRRFKDTRPQHMTAHDEFMLSRRKVPIWYSSGGRKPRLLDLDHEAIQQFVTVAAEHKITMGARYKGGPHHKSVTSITGAVLEAIGLGFLTPSDWPQESGEPKSPIATTQIGA